MHIYHVEATGGGACSRKTSSPPAYVTQITLIEELLQI